MFMVYNGVLRAMSTGGKIPAWGGAHAGESVQGRFTTTIHAINSGVVKLSRIQPAYPVSFIDGTSNVKWVGLTCFYCVTNR